MHWGDEFYADLALPFGMKSSPGIWERYAALAEWVLKRRGVKHVLHYVDDYLFAGAADTKECAAAIATTAQTFGMHSASPSLDPRAALTLSSLPAGDRVQVRGRSHALHHVPFPGHRSGL